MKKTAIVLAISLSASFAPAESILQPVNDKGYGTFSGRLQSLSMYRDYEGVGNGANTTLGGILGYATPGWAGFDAGLAYNYAGEVHQNNNSGMLANEEINVLNEAWLRYRLLSNTTLLVGRRINNGEVFRADDFRQKSRSIETVQLEAGDLPDTRLTIGHAIRLSNWIASGDRADFNDFSDVFGVEEDTDGVTWGEITYTGVRDTELALFNAYAWDVANLVGVRAAWDVTEQTSLLGIYRYETDVGSADAHSANVYGLSLRQHVNAFTLEPGYFSVHGDSLQFQETTTGINHPLGSSMIICSGQFNGDSDTAYLKAVTKVGTTTLYGLYNYTWQDHDITPFDGQELNVVVKQPIVENLAVALKGGIGEHNGKRGEADVDFLDARLFVTYSF